MLTVRAGAVLTFGNRFEHIRDVCEFHTWATLRPAPFDLRLVQYLPVGVRHEVGLSLLQQLQHGLRVAGGSARQRRRVRQQEVNRFLRILLVGADHAFRTTLDPADRVFAYNILPGLRIDHTTAQVRDDAFALVERYAG